MQGQHVLSPMLGIAGGNGERRRRPIELETVGREARNFLSSQAGKVSECAGPRPHFGREFLDGPATLASSLDKAGDFIRGQCPSRVPHVGLLVEAFDALERIAEKSFRHHAPITKRHETFAVAVKRPVRQVVQLPNGMQADLRLLCVEVSQGIEMASVEDPAHSPHDELDVLASVARKARLERSQVVGNRSELLFSLSFSCSASTMPDFRNRASVSSSAASSSVSPLSVKPLAVFRLPR